MGLIEPYSYSRKGSEKILQRQDSYSQGVVVTSAASSTLDQVNRRSGNSENRPQRGYSESRLVSDVMIARRKKPGNNNAYQPMNISKKYHHKQSESMKQLEATSNRQIDIIVNSSKNPALQNNNFTNHLPDGNETKMHHSQQQANHLKNLTPYQQSNAAALIKPNTS